MRDAFEILLIEDNPADLTLASKLFEEVGTPYVLRVARDGVEALEGLLGKADSARPSVPDLILLDLNVPRKDGRELLREIKSHPRLKRIPVIILTTSESKSDVAACYDLHANCYLIKPIGLDEFKKLIGLIEAFWLGIAVLPPKD